MNFRRGQKVVFLGNDFNKTWDTPFSQNRPTKGCVYTIRDIGEFCYIDGVATSLWLYEITNPPCHRWTPNEVGFKAENFRPVCDRKTDISVFKNLLVDITEPNAAR
jgi:hypothetical protein